MDIKNAFKIIPIKPEDFQLLGFQFNGSYYFDKTLPFGASISFATVERFSSFLKHCVVSRVNSGLLIHYIDDFFGGDKSRSLCGDLMSVFSKVMVKLGVSEAVEKTEGRKKQPNFVKNKSKVARYTVSHWFP